MAKDPICEMEVNERDAQSKGLTAQHDGKSFYFCCQDCKETFEKFPDTYSRLNAPPLEGLDDADGGFASPGE